MNTCATCEYRKKVNEQLTVCRRFPPTVLLISATVDTLQGRQIQQVAQPVHPAVKDDDACGEHKPATNLRIVA